MVVKIISSESFAQLKKFFQYGIGNLFAILIPLIVAKRIIDVCGEENFGKVSIALAVCFTLSILIEYGSFVSPLRKVSVYRTDRSKLNKIFSTVFYGRTLLFLVTISLLLGMVFFIPYFSENAVLYILSCTIFIGQVLSPLYFFQGLEDFKNTALFTALSKVVYVVLILLIITEESDFIYVNLLLGFSNAVVFAVGTVFLLKKYQLQLIRMKLQETIQYIKEDAHLLINSFSMVSITHAPVIFIGFLAGEFWAGLYKVLDIFITLFRNYLLLFFNSIYPKTCLLLKESHARGARFILKYSLISSAVLVVIVIFSVLVKDYLLYYFLKENAQLISGYFNWIGIPVILASFNIPFLQVLFYYEKKKYYATVYFIAAITNIVACYALIYFYQITGLIIALSITELLITVLFLISTEYFNKDISVLKPQKAT